MADPTETVSDQLLLAFLVGRNQYLTEELAYRCLLDPLLSGHKLHFQIAQTGSQVWQDWLVVDEVGVVTIPSFNATPPGLIRGRVEGQVAATTVLSYAVGVADVSFMVSANVLITAYVSGSFSLQVDYTDEEGVPRAVIVQFEAGGALNTVLAGASPNLSFPQHYRCKAGTTITVTTTGTFTSLTYNAEAVLQPLG